MPIASIAAPNLGLTTPSSNLPGVSVTPEISRMLSSGCAVAVGVSGGADSVAAAVATAAYLDQVGHTGPRVLIHSDLGAIEWTDSLRVCKDIASHLEWELMVVRRKAGGMISRWEKRWTNNVERYAALSCVKLILPWSTPAMRFCTSELKVDVICSALKKRFVGQPILNVVGIRREESPARSRMAVSAVQTKLNRKSAPGMLWHPVIDWKKGDVFNCMRYAGIVPHEAYTTFGCSRVSCSFCILASRADIIASSYCSGNTQSLLRLIDLEASSTFAFQGAHWLADSRPEVLDHSLRRRIQRAKIAADVRKTAEAAIPPNMLYTKGWPTHFPSMAAATKLARARQEVARAVGIEIACTSASAVRDRYAELLQKHAA